MTITAKDFASKAAVAFVAVAMIFTMFAPSAKAQSSEDLQTMINTLLAQIAALQAQVGQGAQTAVGTSSVCPYTWTRDLNVGATGADVMKLQQFLNSNPDTRVSASGAGSVGAETSYYGPATAAAVSKMQVMYRAEILTPVALVNPTGFFGPSSRAKANALCVAAPVVVVPGETPGTVPGTTPGTTVTLQGEASLSTMEIDSASDSEIAEGKDDQEVAEVTVEFSDGDASISRLDVKFSKASADAFDAFETISLWVDGDMVAEMDASNEDDFQNDEKTMRFSNLDIIGMEDEEVVITIAVSTQNNLDGAELGSWDVSVESMRFFDADGVATTETTGYDFGSTESFTIEVAGFEDEVLVKTSSNDPDATTLKVENDSKSDWYNVFTFDLDTDDSINDIEFNRIDVEVFVSSSTYNTLVDDAELELDGITIDNVTVTGGNTATATLSFDVDGDVTVDAGDRVAAELMLRFKSLNSGNEGVTITARILTATVTNIDAQGADDILNGKLSGSATGDPHTLRTKGINVSKKSVSSVVTTVDAAGVNDYGTYSIVVDVTAFEQDVRFSTNPATSTAYALEDGAGNAAVAGTRSVTLSSTADENGGFFEINEGETETVTITVTYTPGVSNTAARLVLSSLKFDETGTLSTADDKTQTTLPAKDYRTDVVTMVN